MPKGMTKGKEVFMKSDYSVECPHCDYQVQYFGDTASVKRRCRLAWKLHCKKCPNGAVMSDIQIGRDYATMRPNTMIIHQGNTDAGAVAANDNGTATGGGFN